MDFAFSDDQLELRSTARRWFADRLPPARIHELADEPDRPGAFGGHDAMLWAELVGLGWVGISTPGGGGGFLDEAVLLEEAGLALLPAPLLSSVVATIKTHSLDVNTLRAKSQLSSTMRLGSPLAAWLTSIQRCSHAAGSR